MFPQCWNYYKHDSVWGTKFHYYQSRATQSVWVCKPMKTTVQIAPIGCVKLGLQSGWVVTLLIISVTMRCGLHAKLFLPKVTPYSTTGAMWKQLLCVCHSTQHLLLHLALYLLLKEGIVCGLGKNPSLVCSAGLSGYKSCSPLPICQKSRIQTQLLSLLPVHQKYRSQKSQLLIQHGTGIIWFIANESIALLSVVNRWTFYFPSKWVPDCN